MKMHLVAAALLMLAACTESNTSGTMTPSPNPAGGHVQASQGQMCGGIAGVQCGSGLYCQYPAAAQCGAADQSGTCQARPQACTREYMPVCGCDDHTYANACTAAAAGVSVVSQGACAPHGSN